MRNGFLCAVAGLSISAVASQLPLSETFEISGGVTNGTVHGQNGWAVEGGTATVQSSIVQSGTQALEIRSGTVTHALSSSDNSLQLSFQARITAKPDIDPAVTNTNTSAAFFINTNLNLVVYNGTAPVVLDTKISTNIWIRFDVRCDYNTMTWALGVNGVNAATNLTLYSANNQLESVLIANYSAAPAYFDELTAEDADDTDNDGLPDWWEQYYFGGITNAIANSVMSNGTTCIQMYIAGLNPDDPADRLALNKTTGQKFNWTRKPGRLYDIYWSSNLLAGFSCIYPAVSASEFEDTDAGRTQNASGFYQIRVRK
ncbi:MAG: hypothetical protein HOO88_01940 [Kiritimatiellaceae bacterium]|nr:hypothetical protein [Kiritimatiellaceae bacterium]